MSEAPQPRSAEDEDSITVEGPLMVLRLRSRNCDPTLQKALDAAEVIRAAGKRIVLFVVIRATSAPPGPAMKVALQTARKRHDSHTAALAVVIEGAGFGAAIHRSILSAMMMLRRGSQSEKIFTTVEEAAAWLVDYLPGQKAIDLVRLASSTGAATR